MNRKHLKNKMGKGIIAIEGDKVQLENDIFHASASPVGRFCHDR